MKQSLALRPFCVLSLLIAAGSVVAASPQPLPQESASKIVRATQGAKGETRQRKGMQNRINPHRRTGIAGSKDAQIDSTQARELYIRRKLRLEQIRAQQQELTKDNAALAANRARMQARRIETARALRLSEKRLTEIEEKIASTRAKVKEQRVKLDEKSEQMSALFSLMQGMSREPPPLLITHTRDALKMIRGGMVLATFYGDIEKLAVELTGEIGVMEKAEKEAEREEQRYRAEKVQNGRLKTQIELLLSENRHHLQANAANLESLDSVKKINLAGLKSLEDMLPTLDADAEKNSAHDDKSAEISPESEKVALQQPGRMQPAIPFANSQGLLPLPVQGRLLVRFGQSDPYGTTTKGVYLEAREGAQVISPCDGLVVYSGQGPVRSYGQLLIINPGGGYHVLLAGMDHIDIQQGQYVLAGEPIAAMGSETHNGERSPKRPTLYVEFRRDQQSIDPEPWWSSGEKG